MSGWYVEGGKLMETPYEGFKPRTIGPNLVVESALFVWLPKAEPSVLSTQ